MYVERNLFVAEIGLKDNLCLFHAHHMFPLTSPLLIPTKKTLFNETYKDAKCTLMK